MRLLGMLHSVIKPLPSQDGQLQLITESAGRNNPAFSFSQELIDAALTRGSGVEEGKMRIYEQYQKSLSKSENISFLKKEYGIGGSSSAVPYTGVGEDHDSKGIELHLGYGEGSPRHIIRGGLNVRKNYGQSEPLSEKSVKRSLTKVSRYSTRKCRGQSLTQKSKKTR